MSERPRIFVVMRHYKRKSHWQDIVQEAHMEQIYKHGGAPIPIPRMLGTETILSSYGLMHGLLIVEGRDLDIRRYGSKIQSPEALLEKPDMARDEIEFALMNQLLKEGQPYLGICRGCHALNVAKGGTLYGDVCVELNSDLKHVDYNNYDDYRHKISIEVDSSLAGWLGKKELPVNSFHHQGIKQLGKGLVAMAHSADGLVEAYYDREHPFRVGLQFHPERQVQDNPLCTLVFKDFVESAKHFMATGKA